MDTQLNESTNHNSIKVPKVVSQRIRKHYYKTLGTKVTNSPLPLPSSLCTHAVKRDSKTFIKRQIPSKLKKIFLKLLRTVLSKLNFPSFWGIFVFIDERTRSLGKLQIVCCLLFTSGYAARGLFRHLTRGDGRATNPRPSFLNISF